MPSPLEPSAWPLVYRMAARVAPLPKRGIEEVHRSIVNRLRRYSATSIADLALQMLWNPPTGEAEELRSAPWLTMLLVKWAMQDNLVSLRVGPSIPPAEFDRLRQLLWELQGPGHGEKPNVWLMLRYLVHVQVEFQRRESWGFLRWPALYARLDPGSTNRRQFRQVMGLEPDAFLDLAYALYAAVLARNLPLGPDYLSPFRPMHGAAVDRTYELFVRDLPRVCVWTSRPKMRSAFGASRSCSSSRICAVSRSCAFATAVCTAGTRWSSPAAWRTQCTSACPAWVRTTWTSSVGCTSST